MYLLYNSFGFSGIYIFVLIMSGLISAIFFNNLVKEKNGLLLSFIVSIFALYCSRFLFAARNQIFSFLIFELEIFGLIELVENGKKKYFFLLVLLEFLLVLVHDTVYIFFIVLMMPYLADILIEKIFNLDNSYKFKKSNLKNLKYLILLVISGLLIGFCTPIFATTYTNLINCMNGLSSNIINELKPINLLEEISLLTITFLAVGMVGFTKTKFKIKDLLFVFGLIIFSMMARRNLFFLYLIGLIYFTNMVTDFLDTYLGEKRKKDFYEIIENSYFIVIIVCFTSIISYKNIISQYSYDYVSKYNYPIQATEWIKENIDYDNMRIWNHFNWGSYLELNGIKVFVDSRSGMYTEQENKNCNVLNDWYSVSEREKNYEEVFEKYEITHILVSNNEYLNKDLSKDENYNLLYDDSSFSLYERNKK